MNDKWEIIRGITTVSSTNKMNIDENNGKIRIITQFNLRSRRYQKGSTNEQERATLKHRGVSNNLRTRNSSDNSLQWQRNSRC